MLTTFMLNHPRYQTLIILTDFPWSKMSLEDSSGFLRLLISNTRELCLKTHTHPSDFPCKLVCPNLYHDRQDIGNQLDQTTLDANLLRLDQTQTLLEQLDFVPSSTLACPDLLPAYGEDTVDEIFDNQNQPIAPFISRLRGFFDEIITLHFQRPS